MNEIKPALTPEEWRNEVMNDPSILGDLRYVGDDHPYLMQKVVALANAALPDDSPYKITQQEVKMLGFLPAAFEPDDAVQKWLPRLAAKLAALLPPE